DVRMRRHVESLTGLERRLTHLVQEGEGAHHPTRGPGRGATPGAPPERAGPRVDHVCDGRPSALGRADGLEGGAEAHRWVRAGSRPANSTTTDLGPVR